MLSLQVTRNPQSSGRSAKADTRAGIALAAQQSRQFDQITERVLASGVRGAAGSSTLPLETELR
jgi:hypothetical protein